MPLFFYMIARQYKVPMPGRFFPDSVVTVMKDGKQMTVSVWHKVANISLQNQLGQTVNLDQLQGKVTVIDFFFTHCASICPILTKNMRHLQDGLKQKDNMKGVDTNFVQFLSLTVDPAHDSVLALKKYADHYGINSDVWWLLTGPKKTIYDFALNELKLGLQDSVSVDSNFVHTDYIVLLDKDRVIRGYYHGTDTAAMAKLADDIVFIMLEKDKKRKSTIFDELKPLLAPILIIYVLGVVLFLRFNRKKDNPKTIQRQDNSTI